MQYVVVCHAADGRILLCVDTDLNIRDDVEYDGHLYDTEDAANVVADKLRRMNPESTYLVMSVIPAPQQAEVAYDPMV
jgi:hypothetical protein